MASRKSGAADGPAPEQPRQSTQEWIAPDDDTNEPGAGPAGTAARAAGKVARAKKPGAAAVKAPVPKTTPAPAAVAATRAAPAAKAPPAAKAEVRSAPVKAEPAPKATAKPAPVKAKPAPKTTAKPAPVKAKAAAAARAATAPVTQPVGSRLSVEKVPSAGPRARKPKAQPPEAVPEVDAAPFEGIAGGVEGAPMRARRARTPRKAERLAAASAAAAETATAAVTPAAVTADGGFSRSDPVLNVVGPATGAVSARPVDPANLEIPGAEAPEGGRRWVPVLVVLAVAVSALGVVLIATSVIGALGTQGQLPGNPGFPGWQLAIGVIILVAIAAAARAYRGRQADVSGNKRGWRWLADSRLIGSVMAALFLLAAVLVYNTPGYTPDVRALPGQVSGLIQQAVASREQGYPRIRISRVHVDLLLVKGDGKTPPVKYEAFTYPNADHLLADKGTPGNTYVYAHARTGMFWELHDLRIGDTVEIDYGGGNVLKYRVTELHPNINWKDFKWLQPTSDDRLTLQTCNGWRDEDPRFIVVAHRVQDTKTAIR